MKEKTPLLVPIAIGLVLLAVLLFMLPDSIFGGFGRNGLGRGGAGDDERLAGKGQVAEVERNVETGRDPSAELLAALLMKLSGSEVKPNEAILKFKDADALKDFLALADQAGLKVLGTLEKLNMVRVGYGDLRALRDELRDHAGDYDAYGANYFVHIPAVPDQENRPQQQEVPFGENMLAFMGVKGNFSTWGKDVTIAILDSGISPHAAFAAGRVRSIDIGMGLNGTSESDGHATAVAALAGGAAAGATGVAPASNLLSIRVTNSEGTSDIFTLAQGIQTAVDNGARVINISLGAYQNSPVLSEMITYATERGSIIVAAAGNDQAAQLTWPAADPRVVSVGAVDALGQQVSFSNSGANLSATAPGLGLSTAWPGNQIVSFDGTSGSAPLMAGAIAAVMSLNPNLSAQQAAGMLTTYSADAGAPGQDPSFGYGTVDIGYALNFANPEYLDPSISSQYFNAEKGQVEFVVQNRSGQVVSGVKLNVNAAGESSVIDVPNLQPGELWTWAVPVNQTQLESEGQLAFTSQLRNPPGLVDQNTGNNRKASVVFKIGE